MVVIALAAGVRCLDLDFCVKTVKKIFSDLGVCTS